MSDERPKTWSELAQTDADQNAEIDPQERDPNEPAYLADSEALDEIDPDASHSREPGDPATPGG